MDLDTRANIFTAFDALRGFSLAVLTEEKRRQLLTRPSLSADAAEELDYKLRLLQPGEEVEITRFHKERTIGEYELGTVRTEQAVFLGADPITQTLETDTAIFALGDILEIEVAEDG